MDLFSIKVEGHEIAYGAAGTVASPPVVFVHGWGASHQFWRETVPAFQNRFRCVALDLPGFGVSERPRREYTVPSLAASLEKFVDAVRLPAFDLVGHSMGGAIATTFALEHPDRVNRLCVINPPFQGRDAFFGFTRFAMLPGIRSTMYLVCQMRWGRRWVGKDFTYGASLGDDLLDDIGRGCYASLLHPVRSMMDLDLVPRLPELKMPVLLVGTDKDAVIRPEQQTYFPSGPNFRTVPIRECGHIPMLERPEEFNRILADFLAPVEAPCLD